jgi:hypothetical protein
MKKLIIFLAIAVMGCCLSGCGAYYNVKVNGYTEAGTTRQITSGGSFCVIENKEAKNPLLEGEIKEKINKLLESQGYSLTTFDKAEYFLFFSYGMGEPRSLTVIVPDYYATGWGVGYGRPGPVYHFWVPPVLFSMPSIITTTYSRWLLINVVEGPAYRTQKVSHPVWAGEARSVGASSDLRTVLNYLLVADFREFGKNTGKAVTVEIKENDPAVAVLGR